MPNLFLSPSVQEYNPYINGLGSEEYYMNLVADAMEPYLISCGISFTRNDPDDTLQQAIALSNAGNYDFHLALHSNAAPPALAGQLQGCDIYYYATSTQGARAAKIFAENLQNALHSPFSAFLNCSINHWNISRFPLSSICDKSSTQNFEISSANILAPPAESSISTEYIKKTLSLYPILPTAALIYPFSYTNLLDFLHDM